MNSNNQLDIKIVGLGHYLPERVVTNDHLAAALGVSADWIERTTGIKERRYVQCESTTEMAAGACRTALEDAALQLDETDLLIGASAAPAQAIPCTAALVHRELSLPSSCFAFDVDVTCLSFLSALHTAAVWIAAGQARQAIVFSSEIASCSLNSDEPESAVLFGDAAAAAVVTRCEAATSYIAKAQFATISEGAEFVRCEGGGTRHHPNDPATVPAMNQFHMKGKEIFRLATRQMEAFLDDFFRDLDWSREEIDVVISHQASRMATEQLIRRYGFSEHVVARNLAERGNCVAASIPLLLCECATGGQLRRGHKALLVGTGAGLTLGAIAMVF